MTNFRLALASTIVAAFSFGGVRPDSLPPSHFRLTVLEIANDASAHATLIKIQTVGAASISVDQELDHNSIALSGLDSSSVREGNVAILASHFVPAGDKSSYLQTLIRVSTPNGNYAGGPATYTLPRTAALSSALKITAKSGVYSWNKAVEIATLQDHPVTLTVGKATR
jgi:hypothetical protein